MDRHVAASLDHWLTTPPEQPDVPVPGEEGYPRCVCGAFLKLKPDRVEGKVLEETCRGFQRGDDFVSGCGDLAVHDVHTFPAYGWEEAHRACERCGRDDVKVLG